MAGMGVGFVLSRTVRPPRPPRGRVGAVGHRLPPPRGRLHRRRRARAGPGRRAPRPHRLSRGSEAVRRGYKPGMPHPGPRRAAAPAVALCCSASPCSPPPRVRLGAGLHLRGERSRRHARPVAAHRADHRQPGRSRVQGGLRRRQPPRVAAADHRQPAVRDDRPRAALRRAVRADRDRRGRGRRAADRGPADPAPASRPERRCPGRRRSRASGRSTSGRPSRRSSPRRFDARPAQPARAARPGHRPLRQRLAAADRHLVRARHQRARQGAARRPRRLADRDVVDSSSIDPSNLTPAQLGAPGRRAHPAVQASLDAIPPIPIPATVAQLKVHAGPQDRGRRQAHPARARPHADRRRAERRRPHGRRGHRRRGAGQLRRRRRPRAAVHVAADRADRRPALQGPREAARRRQPPLRRQARDDPLHGDGQGRGAAARPPHRALHRHGEAAAQEAPGHQQGALPGRIAKEKSLRLKLVRRMLVSSTSVRGSKVTIAGRVVRPLGVAGPARWSSSAACRAAATA